MGKITVYARNCPFHIYSHSYYQTTMNCFGTLNWPMFGGLVEYGLHLSHETFVPPHRHRFRVLYSGVKCSTSSTLENMTLNQHQKRMIVAEAERRRLAHEPSSGQPLSLWAKKRWVLPFLLIGPPSSDFSIVLQRCLREQASKTQHQLKLPEMMRGSQT